MVLLGILNSLVHFEDVLNGLVAEEVGGVDELVSEGSSLLLVHLRWWHFVYIIKFFAQIEQFEGRIRGILYDLVYLRVEDRHVHAQVAEYGQLVRLLYQTLGPLAFRVLLLCNVLDELDLSISL